MSPPRDTLSGAQRSWSVTQSHTPRKPGVRTGTAIRPARPPPPGRPRGLCVEHTPWCLLIKDSPGAEGLWQPWETCVCCFPVKKLGLEAEGESSGNAEKLAEYICSSE